jgi:hypothetical protein
MQSYRTAATRLRHPVNISLQTNAPLGVRIANDVTGFLGSWRFIIIQTIVVSVWVVGNIYLLFHFDPYPFIFLNLAFSTQAAYAVHSSCSRAINPLSGIERRSSMPPRRPSTRTRRTTTSWPDWRVSKRCSPR